MFIKFFEIKLSKQKMDKRKALLLIAIELKKGIACMMWQLSSTLLKKLM